MSLMSANRKTTPAPRRATLVGERRNARGEILVAAARLFSASGVAGTTMEEIAAAAGVRSPSLYYYFENKETIVSELSLYAVEESAVFATSLSEEAGSAIERLRQLLTAHIERLVTAPFDLWFLVTAGGRPGDPIPGFEKVSAAYSSWVSRVQSLIAEAAKKREIPSCDVELAAQLIFGCIEGVLEWRHHGHVVDAETPVEFAIRGLGWAPVASAHRAQENSGRTAQRTGRQRRAKEQ
ncbi:TetR/AcrR family transcriptional regulator [Mycobacterium sp. OAE908]|uniref:TetR/AcrR family transcriptional regulator n=1 Tax=Mycobacterium sp. OAE908 TaxID=2817899 RepID=UPI001AE211A2